jgi:hypothetical protein
MTPVRGFVKLGAASGLRSQFGMGKRSTTYTYIIFVRVIPGKNRNEELQLLSYITDFKSQVVFIPAINPIADWWLQSERSCM